MFYNFIYSTFLVIFSNILSAVNLYWLLYRLWKFRINWVFLCHVERPRNHQLFYEVFKQELYYYCHYDLERFWASLCVWVWVTILNFLWEPWECRKQGSVTTTMRVMIFEHLRYTDWSHPKSSVEKSLFILSPHYSWNVENLNKDVQEIRTLVGVK